MEWVALIGTVLSFVLWAVKQAEAQREKNAPERKQQETDADVLNPDRRWYSLRVSDLHDKLQQKRASARRRSGVSPGDPVPPGDDVRD